MASTARLPSFPSTRLPLTPTGSLTRREPASGCSILPRLRGADPTRARCQGRFRSDHRRKQQRGNRRDRDRQSRRRHQYRSHPQPGEKSRASHSGRGPRHCHRRGGPCGSRQPDHIGQRRTHRLRPYRGHRDSSLSLRPRPPAASSSNTERLLPVPTPFPLFAALLPQASHHQGVYTVFELISDPAAFAKAKRYVFDHIAAGNFNPRIRRQDFSA